MRVINTNCDDRIETGALKFDDDWAGLFIRGDDCITLDLIFREIVQDKPLADFEKRILHGYLSEIENRVLKI
jgi:predicted hydrocarbon binding protein